MKKDDFYHIFDVFIVLFGFNISRNDLRFIVKPNV